MYAWEGAYVAKAVFVSLNKAFLSCKLRIQKTFVLHMLRHSFHIS